jgi:hypothetical protein
MRGKIQKVLTILNLVFLIAPRIILLLIILGISILTMTISIFFKNCANNLFPKELRSNRYKYTDGLNDILSTWFD